MATASAIAIHSALVFQEQLNNPELNGRKLSVAPAHLSRILYIPSHNDKATTHLPIYEFAEDYRNAVRDEPIGSSRYKTSFGLMKKPVGDGRSGDVQYLVDFELPLGIGGGKGGMKGTVRRRALGTGVEVGLSMPAGADDDFEMLPSSTTARIPVDISYPVPATITKFGTTRNPWFTFTIPNLLDADRTLQWQVHPAEHGLLRYTLVELSPPSTPGQTRSAVGNDSIVRAIYHNVGLGFSLQQRYSEGALLIPEDLDFELEALIVASLLGMLWQVRRMGQNLLARARRSSRSDAKPVNAETDDFGPPKHKLFRKILRRMT